jgi:hypothetical protein
MGCVNEAGEPVRAPVGSMRCRDEDAVVAPAPFARERGDRHQLDRGHPELAQRRQAGDGSVERALRGERADVQLVDNQADEVERRCVGRPDEGGGVENPRGAPQPVRLPAGAGIGERTAVEQEPVVVARLGGQTSGERARRLTPERPRAAGELDRDLLGIRSPDAELDQPGAARHRAEGPEARARQPGRGRPSGDELAVGR